MYVRCSFRKQTSKQTNSAARTQFADAGLHIDAMANLRLHGSGTARNINTSILYIYVYMCVYVYMYSWLIR